MREFDAEEPDETPPAPARPATGLSPRLRALSAVVAAGLTLHLVRIFALADGPWTWWMPLDAFILPPELLALLAWWLALGGGNARTGERVASGLAGGCAFGTAGFLAGVFLFPWIGGQLGPAICFATAPLGFAVGVAFGLGHRRIEAWVNR